MSPDDLRVVVVEDRPADVELIGAALRRDGLETATVPVDSYEQLAAALSAAPDVVLADHNVPGMSISQVLRTVRTSAPGVPVIVVTGALDDDTAAALFEQGVSDVLLKDRLARLGQAVRTAVGTRHLEQAVVVSHAEQARIEGLLASLVQHSPSAIGLLHPGGEEIFSNTRFRVLAKDGPGRSRLAAMPSGSEHADGDEVFLVTRFAVSDDTDPTAAFGVILTDITQQKAVQAQLRATQAELQQQSRELRRHNDELQELDRLKSDLVNTVSHELRTPLTSILGYGELIEDHLHDLGDETGLQLLSTLQRNSARLLGLVENLLQLATEEHSPTATSSGRPAEAGQRPDVDVNQLLLEACCVLLPAAQRRGVTMERHVAADLPPVAADAGQLERVLLNLGSNAVKFAAANGRVVWRTRLAGPDLVELEVEDDGVGIASDDLERLGHRFFRTESARTNHVPGTGLGLAVVRAAVAGHGGELTFASQPGCGTRVTVRLPVRGALPPPPP